MRADLNIFFISLYYRGREGKEGKSLCGGNELRRFPFFLAEERESGLMFVKGIIPQLMEFCLLSPADSIKRR